MSEGWFDNPEIARLIDPDHALTVTAAGVPLLIAQRGRIGMRNAARQLLEAIDQLAEHELAAAGYTRDEITALERIAAWRIDGVLFGNWPGGIS